MRLTKQNHLMVSTRSDELYEVVLLDIFDEKDKTKLLRVILNGQTIFVNSYVYQIKFEVDNSTLFFAFIFLY